MLKRNISYLLALTLLVSSCAGIKNHLQKPTNYTLPSGVVIQTKNPVIRVTVDILIVNKEVYPKLQRTIAQARISNIISEEDFNGYIIADTNIRRVHNILLDSIVLYVGTEDAIKRKDVLLLISGQTAQLIGLIKEVFALARLNGLDVPKWNEISAISIGNHSEILIPVATTSEPSKVFLLAGYDGIRRVDYIEFGLSGSVNFEL